VYSFSVLWILHSKWFLITKQVVFTEPYNIHVRLANNYQKDIRPGIQIAIVFPLVAISCRTQIMFSERSKQLYFGTRQQQSMWNLDRKREFPGVRTYVYICIRNKAPELSTKSYNVDDVIVPNRGVRLSCFFSGLVIDMITYNIGDIYGRTVGLYCRTAEKYSGRDVMHIYLLSRRRVRTRNK